MYRLKIKRSYEEIKKKSIMIMIKRIFIGNIRKVKPNEKIIDITIEE